MATFLEIVQDLHFEAGAAGLPPTSVVNQVGEADRLVRWVRKAEFFWQSRWANWKFMHRTLPAGFRTLRSIDTAPPDDLAAWDFRTFFIRVDEDSGWLPLQAQEYDVVKELPPETVDGLPLRVVVLPNDYLRFSPLPDREYDLRADYYRKPVRLEENSQVSMIPDAYVPTVVLGTALGYVADYEDAPELKRRSVELVEDHATQLQAAYLPQQAAEWQTGADLVVTPE